MAEAVAVGIDESSVSGNGCTKARGCQVLWINGWVLLSRSGPVGCWVGSEDIAESVGHGELEQRGNVGDNDVIVGGL